MIPDPNVVSCSQTFSSFTLGQEEKGSGEHSTASLLPYPISGISHLKGFLCAASGMLISLNDVIMSACNIEKDNKVVRNALPTNTANTISHHCSLISRSIQVSCNLFNNSSPKGCQQFMSFWKLRSSIPKIWG